MKAKELKKFTIEFTTLSPLSLSPRESQCFYKGLDFSDDSIKKHYDTDICNEVIKEEKLKIEKVNILYPFYQYGEYEGFSPKKADYYIPGTSIKGAFLRDEDGKEALDFYVDDVSIKKDQLTIRVPKKLQFVKELYDDGSRKQPKFDDFFPNVAVEMLKAREKFSVIVYAKDELFLEKIKNNVIDLTKDKIKLGSDIIDNMKKIVTERLQSTEEKNDEEKKGWECSKEELEKYNQILNQEANNKNVIFLGGYKGKAFSKVDLNLDNPYEGTFYLDSRSGLPFGLVEIGKITEVQTGE
jgi:hypothetical protein